jgi:hypothetical protein
MTTSKTNLKTALPGRNLEFSFLSISMADFVEVGTEADGIHLFRCHYS